MSITHRSRGRMAACLSSLLSCCAAGAVFAADVPIVAMDGVTVTSASASGTAVDTALAPASISVITHEELEGKSYRDVREALESIPGVYVNAGQQRKGTGGISIRGMDSKYTLVLIDGKPQGSGQGYYNGRSSGAEYGWLPPLAAIKRIEVIRGPMSSVYGSDALGGVINIITRRIPGKLAGSINLDTMIQQHSRSGNRNQIQYYVTAPLVEDTLGLTVYGAWLDRDEDDFTGGFNGFKRASTTARVDWKPDEANLLSFEAGYAGQDSTWRKGHSNAQDDGELETRRSHEAISHELDWSNGFQTDSWIQHEKLDNRTQNAVYERTTLHTSTVMPLGDHVLTMGAQYRKQKTENPTRGMGNHNLDRWDMALFAEDEWFITDTFSLTGGLRGVHDEKYGSQLVPRLYGVYAATPEFTLKGGISAGYRTPDLKQGDSNWIEGGGGPRTDGRDVGNDNLKPEKSLTYEIAALWSGMNGVEAGVTVFHTDFKDKIDKLLLCDGNNLCTYPGVPGSFDRLEQYYNVGRAHVDGVELTFGFPVGETVKVNTSYTYTDSEQETGDNKGHPLNNQPKHRAAISVNWQPVQSTDMELSARYRGKSQQLVGRGGNLTTAYPGYAIVDATIKHRITDNFNIYGGIYNLLNKEITYDEYNRTLDGRRYNVGVNLMF